MPKSIDNHNADDAHLHEQVADVDQAVDTDVDAEAPVEACAESNTGMAQPLPLELGLEADPDTSMVTSLRLHLVSEHDVWEGASLKADDAAALHAHLHAHGGHEDDQWGHHAGSTQFRPGRALAGIASRYADPDVAEGMLAAVGTPPTPTA